MNGESVMDEGVNTPLLASRPPSGDQEDDHLLDVSKLPLVPKRTRTRSRAQALLHQSQVPIFMKRNCVVWHYRPQSRFRTAALSVFRLHNETVNIWSHALGAVLMWCLALEFSMSILTPQDIYSLLVNGDIAENSHLLLEARVPIWPLIVFDLLSSVTLLLSAVAHTFCCMPQPVSSFFWQIDQLGIAIGILAVYFPGVMYLFHGYPPDVPRRWILCISVIALVCGVVGVAAAALGSTAMKKGTRVVAYIAMSACSLIPLSEVWTEQTHDKVYRQTICRYVGCAAVAAYGAVMYASGVPERFRPGMFDIFGASHQIFHISIVICLVMFHIANVHLWAVLSSEGATEKRDGVEALNSAAIFSRVLQLQ